MHNTDRGKKGEEQAAAFLKAKGMEIIARNIRTKSGEVDIVAKEGGTIIFAEVKAWDSYNLEDLQYGINPKKQRKIIETAKYFLFKNRKYSNMAVRFDVLFIKENSVTHLESAFTEGV